VSETDRKREDDWFRRNEEKLIAAARVAREKREHERAAREKDDERARLKELHYMCCPKCGHGMTETTLEGVVVDQCSFCEGLYFDAGEIGQLLLQREEDRKGFLRRILGL
jgi:uncharacterized protein